MAPGLAGRLKSARNAARDYLEELVPHEVLPRRTRPEVFRRLGIVRSAWDRFEEEFKDDVGLALRGDADLLFSMIEALKPPRFLEIGTWRGGTAALVKTLSPGTEVVTINFPDPEVVNNPLRATEIGQAFLRRGLDVKLVWADSADLLGLGLGTFDAIYVDGDHSYRAALRDLTNSWSILEPAGTLLFHDFVQETGPDRPPHCRRVVRAFRRFARARRDEFADGFCMEGSWIGVVRKRS
jgi:predicted O-methyltransferase YrrM